jgi:Spa2 homology domain (SHD) of GIT
MVQVRLAFVTPNLIPSSPPTLVPFVRSLPAQAGLHPERNQAREKLATLPLSRFQDLTSDLCHELGRRYPACNEVVMSFPLPFCLTRH